jgi:predicted tellurium resistance membrane protein TerC
VRNIVVADLIMSLDNMIAIGAAAHGSVALIVFGLLLSVPLIIGGATLLIGLLSRFPILVWGGAALLGWIAGDLIVSDPGWRSVTGAWPKIMADYGGGAIGALLVLAIGGSLRLRRNPSG